MICKVGIEEAIKNTKKIKISEWIKIIHYLIHMMIVT
jgi:hypothetical protein